MYIMKHTRTRLTHHLLTRASSMECSVSAPTAPPSHTHTLILLSNHRLWILPCHKYSASAWKSCERRSSSTSMLISPSSSCQPPSPFSVLLLPFPTLFLPPPLSLHMHSPSPSSYRWGHTVCLHKYSASAWKSWERNKTILKIISSLHLPPHPLVTLFPFLCSPLPLSLFLHYPFLHPLSNLLYAHSHSYMQLKYDHVTAITAATQLPPAKSPWQQAETNFVGLISLAASSNQKRSCCFNDKSVI